MKFAWFSLVMNLPNAVTGKTLSTQQKFENIIKQAQLAEELGFEAYGIGERHGSPFTSLEDNIANGPALIGSPDQVIEKILNYQAAFGHQVLSLSVDGLTESEQREQMERFASDVAPVLRREVPSSVWEDSTSTLGLPNLLNA